MKKLILIISIFALFASCGEQQSSDVDSFEFVPHEQSETEGIQKIANNILEKV